MEQTKFSWVKLYPIIAKKLLEYKNNRSELIKLNQEMISKNLKAIPPMESLVKEAKQKVLLEDIDPFTFIANFNRGIKPENRIEIINYLLDKWELKFDEPINFTGIPVVNNLNAMFFPFAFERQNDDIPKLWELFEQALNNNIQDETFNYCFNIRYVKYKITTGLFWIAPEKYLSLDSNIREFLANKNVIENKRKKNLDFEKYNSIIQKTKEKFPGKTFYEISDEAFEEEQKNIVEKKVGSYITNDVLDAFLNLINMHYPNWQGINDIRFLKEEINYKKESSQNAKKLLGKEALRGLLNEGNYDEIIKRIEKVGQSTNLLYLSTPKSGDMNILYQDNLNKKEFCQEFYDLIYNDKPVQKRMENFINYTKKNNLPNKWTFITYFLFLIYPETEFFIKPSKIKLFLDFIDSIDSYAKDPSPPWYKDITKNFEEIKVKLIERGYNVKDMIEIQSLIWVAMNTYKQQNKIVKYLTEFAEVAEVWLKKETWLEDRYNFFNNFIKKENLENAEWKDFQEMGNYIHAFSAMPIAKANALGNPNHPIEHYRNSFIYLVYGEDDIETRIKNFTLNEEYKLKFFGDSIISEILSYVFPDKFVIYNRRDVEAIKLLGIKTPQKRGDKFVDKFLNYNRKIQPVIEQYKKIIGKKTNMPINYEVDQFFSYLYETHITEKENIERKSNKNYWLIAPGENARLWNNFLQNNLVSIGWYKLGDLSNYESKKDLKAKMKEIYNRDSSFVNDISSCYDFANSIQIGDIIFARKGRNTILGLGEIISEYFYDEKREEYRNCRKVKWIKTGEWKTTNKLPIKTLTQLDKTNNYYDELMKFIEDNKTKQEKLNEKNIWWLNANPDIWDITNMKVGNTNDYNSHNEKGKKRRIYKHFQSIKIGDLIVGYSSTPNKIIDSICEVINIEPENNEIVKFDFKKIEGFKNPVTWDELINNPELENCEPLKGNQGSLFKVSKDEFKIIRNMIDAKNLSLEIYTIDNALEDLFMSKEKFQTIINLLEYKKNIILQGPPGVGKTFIAKRLAFVLMGEKDNDKVEMIQFHQSYSYEDFMQGYRPTKDGKFILKNGIFYEFCKKAQQNSDKKYVFIIDEINRGNLSKIFGELMMLIEKDKRGEEFEIPLTYSDNKFSIPDNLYLIGTMNTADRSLAIVDYALRRRFGFITLNPSFKNDKFKEFLNGKEVDDELIEKIKDKLTELNEIISKDNNLGKGFQIGHSYFCPDGNMKYDKEWYKNITENEIKPLLKEYWFDDPEKAKKHSDNLE